MAAKTVCLKEILNSVQDFLNAVKNANPATDLYFSYTVAKGEEQNILYKDIEKPFSLLLDRLSAIKYQGQESIDSSDIVQVKSEPLSPVQNSEDGSDGVSNVEDADFVQIKVDRDEIDRRISCFMTRKRKEVDDWNAKEFCNNHVLDDENPLIEEINSCARVDAVYVSQPGCRSHIKLSRVENQWGPQTTTGSSENRRTDGARVFDTNPFDDIEERLKNMESHLRIKSESSFRRSICSRLKALEDRILFLEGLSPDYFCPRISENGSLYVPAASEKETALMGCSMSSLQQRMRQLKEELHSRMKSKVTGASVT